MPLTGLRVDLHAFDVQHRPGIGPPFCPYPLGAGGGRRRRWLFLDQPVASLDIGHQLQVMDLVSRHAARGGGVVAMMHDLNLTAMFAHRVTLRDGGRVLAEGAPVDVLTDGHPSTAYGAALRVNRIPQAGTVFLLPQAAGG